MLRRGWTLLANDPCRDECTLQCAKLGIPTEGSEIYVTHFPCLACTKALLQVGVKGINYLHDYRNDPYAQALIEQLGVSVHQVVLDSQHFSKLQK